MPVHKKQMDMWLNLSKIDRLNIQPRKHKQIKFKNKLSTLKDFVKKDKYFDRLNYVYADAEHGCLLATNGHILAEIKDSVSVTCSLNPETGQQVTATEKFPSNSIQLFEFKSIFKTVLKETDINKMMDLCTGILYARRFFRDAIYASIQWGNGMYLFNAKYMLTVLSFFEQNGIKELVMNVGERFSTISFSSLDETARTLICGVNVNNQYHTLILNTNDHEQE
jgi:hypothetical protein